LVTLQEEDLMEPEPHYEDFRSLRRKIFEWEGELWACTAAAAWREAAAVGHKPLAFTLHIWGP
jgi:hypothetical protein